MAGSKYIVETIFKGKDLLAPIWKKNIKNARLFGDQSSRSFAKAAQGASMFGSIFKGILAANVVSRGLSTIQRGTETAVREFVDFDAAITQAGAKFPQTVKRGTAAFDELSKVARQVGAETKFSASEAAGGLEFLAMAGFNAQQAMAALPGTTDLAIIANTDLARSTDIASDALGAFNLMTQDAGQLQKNLGRINDVMAKTITSTNTDLEQLFETMKFAGPVATTAGASIETFATIAGQMAQAGIKGSLAGTAMRAMFLRLVDPPREARQELNKLGVSILDKNKNMRDMFDIIDSLNKNTSKMSDAQRTAALSTIFGARAISGVTAVLNVGADSLRDFRKTLINSGGASKDMARDIQKSLQNRLLALRSALLELGFKFIEAFIGKGSDSLDILIEKVRDFDVKPIIQGIKDIISFAGSLKRGIETLSPVIKGAAAAIIFMKGAIMAVQAAQWIWNAAMLANPIGLIIVGIGVLIGIIVILATRWEEIAAMMNLIWIQFRNTVLSAVDAVVGAIIDMINWIIKAGQKIGLFENTKLISKDQTAELQRQNDLIKARNNLMIASIKNNEDLSKIATQKIAEKQIQARQLQNIGKYNPLVTGEDAISDITMPMVGFEGKMTFENAPKGAKVQSKTKGAPPIAVEMLGQQ